MGWAKIRNKIQHVGNVIDPHALIITTIRKNTGFGETLHKNVTTEGTKGVANYGGYAALAAQVIPGVGTAVGAGIGVATVAAQIKLKQDAIAKQNAANKAQQAQWAAEDTAAIREQNGAGTFVPTTTDQSTTNPTIVTDYVDGAGRRTPGIVPTDGRTIPGIGGAQNILDNFLGTSVGASSTGASSFAPNASSSPGEGSKKIEGPTTSRFMVPLVIGAAVAAGLALAVLALKR